MATDRIGRAIKSAAGKVYVNTNVATDDSARVFEASCLYLEDVVIIVKNKAQLFGTVASQVYPVGAEETLGFSHIDLATLYFKSAVAGENGTVDILGVED